MRTPETLDHGINSGCGIISFISYFMSALLTVGSDFLHFLGENSQGFGVLIGLLTVVINIKNTFFPKKPDMEKNG